jgi:hypothetical protein
MEQGAANGHAIEGWNAARSGQAGGIRGQARGESSVCAGEVAEEREWIRIGDGGRGGFGIAAGIALEKDASRR